MDLGTSRAAAEALGITEAAVRNSLARVRRKAARDGYPSPSAETTGAAPGFHMRGVSVLRRGGTNEPVLWWDKSAKDRDDKFAVMLESLEGLEDRMAGRSLIVPAPLPSSPDLLAVYPMGDPHVGMYAWAAQTGNDFNLNTAVDDLRTAMQVLVDRAPEADEALILDVGDFLNYDTFEKMTLRGRHPQDTDVQWEQMVDASIDLMVQLIYMALRKHVHVTVFIVRGNHDDHTAYMLAKVLKAYFREDQRVSIQPNPGTFLYYDWGQVLIGAAHGNQPKKIEDLEPIMARDCAHIWRPNQHRIWYTGHLHHDRSRDLRTVRIETLRTLAPGNNWSHSAGFRSFQDMKLDVYHRQFGRRRTEVVSIEEIRAWQAQ